MMLSKPLVRLLSILLLLATGTVAGSEPVHDLIEAVRKGDTAEVLRMLKNGAEPNVSNPIGMTPLHVAAYHDDLHMARHLIEAGAELNAANHFGITPVLAACENGNAKMIRLLLDADADPNAATPSGATPLMFAARTGIVPALDALLDHGADVNAHEHSRRQTALMWAAAEGYEPTVQTLLKAGAEVDARSQGGFTAFLFAVRQGCLEVVESLLKAGADVNQYLPAQGTTDGWNESEAEGAGPHALGLAIKNAHYELAARLLDAGADPNFMWQGRNALHVLTWTRRPGTGSNNPSPPGSGNLTSLDIVHHLVDHGIDLDTRMKTRNAGVRTRVNMKGVTAFFLAARAADVELMRLLADLGADPTLPNEENTTPLHVAAGVGVYSPGEDPGTPEEVLEAVKLTVELGNDVNAVDDDGETAMHGAAYKHAPEVPAYLAEQGAQIEVWNRKNEKGWTPLRIASGVYRTMNLRRSPETAAAIRELMLEAGVPVELESEADLSDVSEE